MKRSYLLVLLGLLALPSLAQEQEKWKLTGTAGANVNGYWATGISDRREPLRYNVGLYPVLSKGNWMIPVQMNAYNLGIGSDYRVLRVGVHPSWKWGSFHLGHSNLRFSNFTQNGRTLFGAGVQINPGLLRFGALWGTTNPNSSSILSNAVQPNAYPQEVLTVKLGLGNRNHFLDLIYLKGEDRAGDVDTSRLELDEYPQENLVLAVRTEHYFFKRKWFIGGEYALSGLTLNQNSRALSDVSDEVPPIPDWLLDPKLATLVASAAEGFLGYASRNFSTKLVYQRIGPDYRSFGTYFFQSDIESIDLNISFRLLKSKLRIKTRGGVRRNNLAGDRSLQTVRARGFLQLYYRPSVRWLITANYSNYQTEQRIADETNRDSLSTAIVSNNMNLSLQHTIIGKSKHRHILRLLGGYQVSADRHETNSSLQGTQNYSGGLQYALYTADGLWQGLASADYIGFEQVQPINHRYGGRIEIKRSFNRGMWQLGVNSWQVWAYRGSNQTSTSFIPGMTLSYRPSLADLFNLWFSYSNQSFVSAASTDFTEVQAGIRYTHRFGARPKAK